MAVLSVSFSIDDNQHLIATVPSVTAPGDPPNTLDVENPLPPAQSQTFNNFAGTADLGAATSGAYLISLTLNGIDTCEAAINIFGLPGALSIGCGVAVTASPSTLGFDCDGHLPAAAFAVFQNTLSYGFGIRYVSRGTPYTRDIDSAETGAFLSADMPLLLVQHPPVPQWEVVPDNGTAWGAAATANAAIACVPKGVSIFCDLEEVQDGSSVADITDFCNNWSASVAKAGYIPGLYVGSNCGLSDDQLSALNFVVFWKSCSNVPTPTQGYAMIQGPCDVQRGDATVMVSVDENNISSTPGALAWLKKQS